MRSVPPEPTPGSGGYHPAGAVLEHGAGIFLASPEFRRRNL